MIPNVQQRHRERYMVNQDLARVLSIEASSYVPGSRWNGRDFRRMLRRPGVIRSVIEDRQGVAAYILAEPVDVALHILNLTVAPDCRLLGMGSQLVRQLQHLLEYDYSQLESVMMLVDERNVGAQLFFRRMGFRCDPRDTRRGALPGGDDMLVFSYYGEFRDARQI